MFFFLQTFGSVHFSHSLWATLCHISSFQNAFIVSLSVGMLIIFQILALYEMNYNIAKYQVFVGASWVFLSSLLVWFMVASAALNTVYSSWYVNINLNKLITFLGLRLFCLRRPPSLLHIKQR
jgi:hypothetical protein